MARRAHQTFGPGPDVLLVDGRPVASLAVARTSSERRRGLLGTTSVVGALWITRCPSVHMLGMAYPIDVAVLDGAGRVLRVATLRPAWGATWPRLRAKATVEMAAGARARWGIQAGSRLTVAPPGSGHTPVTDRQLHATVQLASGRVDPAGLVMLSDQ